MLAIIFRTLGAWGAGIGRRLTAAEVDTNFYNIKLAIEDLFSTRPQPIGISSIERNGLNLIITLDNAVVFELPWPILQFHYRGPWVAFTFYEAADVFVVPGVGLFSVLVDHTALATFDRDLLIDGNVALNLLMAADSGSMATAFDYDIGTCYQGVIKESPDGVPLWELPITRSLTIPATTSAGTLNRARLREPPSTAVQVFPILHNDTTVGTVTFAIGANSGVVVITADIDLVLGDVIAAGKPVTEDATAAMFSIMLAATRNI